MVANNGGKVSNLTVAPHRFIPLPFSPRTGCPPFIQDQRRTVGVPTPNYREARFIQGWLPLWGIPYRVTPSHKILHRTVQNYTKMHMASNEEHSVLNKITPQEE